MSAFPGCPRAAFRGRYLPALDGLRALSVLMVIGFHAELRGFEGGFLGVEVFFVLSGYLITSLLLIERSHAGRISLTAFWTRRARRLLPALFCVLAFALALSLTLAPDCLGQTRGDALAALFYVSNWWQIVQHHSYFMGVDRPPLLLHLWSLAVEEQFYLVWPLLVAWIGRPSQRWVFLTAAAGSALSSAWAAHLFDPSADPTRLYIATDTRLSGLMIGAALAAILPAPLATTPLKTERPSAALELFAAAALASLAYLMLELRGQQAFLYRGGLGLVDVASSALIIAALQRTAVARLLSFPPLTWIGRRSYGLYLWHWPIFAITRPEMDLALSGLPLLALRLGLTALATELCYRVIEQPVREGALDGLLRGAARRRWLLDAVALLALILGALALFGTGSAAARFAEPARTAPSVFAPSKLHSEADQQRASTRPPSKASGIPLDPIWPKTLTLLTDSVGLALSRALPAALPGWKVEVLGRPALMVKQVVPEFLNARGVGSVVVIALGHNSLFERDRKNYERWSLVWDRSAEKLIRDLQACGAKKLIWLTLREPSLELVTDAGRDQYERYAWFFPYVNEHVRALAERHPELTIADWQAISNVPDITKDLIHLNPSGVAMMTELVAGSVLGPKPHERATP